MEILYLAGREHSYPRNDVLLRAFRRLGEVSVINNPTNGSQPWRTLSTFCRALPALLAGRHSLVFVGFYGHLLMPPVRLFARAPILFDAFVSTYDTLCFDRRLYSPASLPGRAAYWLDQTACRSAARVLLDTSLQVDYFEKTFALPSQKLQAIPVGCNEDLFSPRPSECTGTTRVLYYSTFQPLHGMDTVVRAAALLQSEPCMTFRLIGQGPDSASVRRLAEQLGLKNTQFVDNVPLDQLPAELAAASICLGGPFGSTAKANRVIPGKIYQVLAMGRPLLAGDTPANRYLLTHLETAYLCPTADPRALAEGILELHRNASLRDHLGAQGRSLYLVACSESVITDQLQTQIEALS